MFKYSAITGTLKRLGYDFLETPEVVLEAIKAAGYDAVDLPGDPQSINIKTMRKLVDSAGLEISEIQAAWAFHHAGESRDLAAEDEESRRRGIDYGKKCVDLAADLGGKYVEVCPTQNPIPEIPYTKLPLHTLRNNFLASAREIAKYALERKINILFEPLNRYEAYPGVLNTVYDAINLIDDLGLPNLGIQPDVYHMNIAEASIVNALRAAGHRIQVMHMRETNDYFMGEGHADYQEIMGILKEIHFDGYISIYMPLIPPELSYRDKSFFKPDLFTVLQKQLEFLKTIEKSIEKKRLIFNVEAPYLMASEEKEETEEAPKIY